MVRVTIDIFSGRPNPSFLLDDKEAREILRQLSSTPEAVTSDEAVHGVLGFRGMVLELDEEPAGKLALPRRLRVGGGVSRDEGRGLELAERLLDRAARLTPAAAGDFGKLGVYDEAALKRLVGEELRQVEARSAMLNAAAADADAPVPVLPEDEEGSVSIQAAAPVLGRDASTWSNYTVGGTCSLEASAFNPTFWNGSSTVRLNNNCYNYANNKRTDTFAQPGKATGAQTSTMACANVGSGAASDGLIAYPTCAGSGIPRFYVALVIWPGVDYHWYRYQSNGYWGHKPGQTNAINTDNSGVVISNPQTANRGGYTTFCGYYFAPTTAQIA
ncbi:MAG TPA: hypothetical protein VF615_26830 [Longimicrobiaceae bacterium]|jgi:hypothetical protein